MEKMAYFWFINQTNPIADNEIMTVLNFTFLFAQI